MTALSVPVFEISKAVGFDAAHNLPTSAEAQHRRLHGHSFRVEATVRGPMGGDPLNPGWVADLNALDAALRALAGRLDHSLLNDHPGLESPTLERLCLWFAERLRPDFPGLSRVEVSRPTVHERCALSLSSADAG